ncbi:leucine-rich repeat protein, partial [Ruminococcus sp.]|uniref:leucine-rich repeat protein n=1 Tax=Ruminococcus sp. TaxID=41978 RepID=UPI002E81ABAF
EDGFISGVESKFNANFDQYVKSNQMVFTKCKLGSVNIKGENNEIGKNFLSDCGEVDSVNIDNTTYLGTTAFYNTKIDDFSINAKTKFDNETFTSSSANNMYVNVDADGNNPELSHVKGEKGSGIAKNSKICNLYFNYANLNGIKTGIVTGLNRFPLGNTEETSIDCDNIYFCNPDFKYVGLSDYKAFKTKTKVYAYGGALSYNIDETITSSVDMFNEWLKDANCEFVNFVKVSDTDIRLKKATFETKTDSIDVDFSSEDTIEVSAEYATDKNDKYAAIEKIDKTKKLDMITESKGSTNFNYRILEKTPDSGLSKEKYNCQLDGQWYTAMTEKKKTLTVGKHEFLVEVAGQKYPFTIEVKKVVEEVAKPTATPVADGKSTKEPTATQAPKTDATQAPGASTDGSPSVVSSPAVTVDPEEVKNITNIRVEYKDKKAYEYSRISTAPEKLFVYVTENGKEELLRSNAQVQLSDYEILAGKVTTIDVTYKGIKASNSIKITGEADTLEYLVNVEYKGKTTVGTKVELKDIRVTAKMKSGNIIDSALNPTMLNEIKINSLTISEGENLLKVTFRDEEKIFDVMAASSSSVTTGDNSDNKLPNENVEKDQLKKGNEFTKNNFIYKVVSINGFTGNVSIVV